MSLPPKPLQNSVILWYFYSAWAIRALETTPLVFSPGTSLLLGKVVVYVLLEIKWKQSFRFSLSVRPSSMFQDSCFKIIHLVLSTMFLFVSKGRRKQIMESLILIWFQNTGNHCKPLSWNSFRTNQIVEINFFSPISNFLHRENTFPSYSIYVPHVAAIALNWIVWKILFLSNLSLHTVDK